MRRVGGIQVTVQDTVVEDVEIQKPKAKIRIELHPALRRFVERDPEEIARMQEEVRRLARERNAVIIAHNYQVPEVQDVADFVGDSLGMAIEASRTDEPVIVVCGVYFMAETAKIINPERTVLIPDRTAGCSVADSIT